jgi:hypothetical protein
MVITSAAPPGYRGEHLGGSGKPVLAEIGDADPQAKPSELGGGGEADSSRTARDDGDGTGAQGWMRHRDGS